LAKPEFSSLPEYENLLLAAQKQLLEPPLFKKIILTSALPVRAEIACENYLHNAIDRKKKYFTEKL